MPDPQTERVKCPDCEGHGEIDARLGTKGAYERYRCPDCNGTGYLPTPPAEQGPIGYGCKACGRIAKTERDLLVQGCEGTHEPLYVQSALSNPADGESECPAGGDHFYSRDPAHDESCQKCGGVPADDASNPADDRELVRLREVARLAQRLIDRDKDDTWLSYTEILQTERDLAAALQPEQPG